MSVKPFFAYTPLFHPLHALAFDVPGDTETRLMQLRNAIERLFADIREAFERDGANGNEGDEKPGTLVIEESGALDASTFEGRMISDIWALSPFRLEHFHDYIQWLFPVPEASRFNDFALRLGEEERAAFAESDALRQRQQK